MKTLLGINGETYLLPETKDLAKVLEVLKGIRPLKGRTNYGPDGDHRYDEAHGYLRKDVVQPPARLRVELVADEDVVTDQEFDRIVEQFEAVQKTLPETVG